MAEFLIPDARLSIDASLFFDEDSNVLFESYDDGILFGSQIKRCLLCDDYKPNDYQREHLFPRVAFKRNPLLKTIKSSPENRIYLCNDHHRNIDGTEKSKIRKFRREGLEGLVHFIASYPRAVNPNLLDLQYHQWNDLFHLTRNSLMALNGDTPEELKDKYERTGELIEGYLHLWQRGDFEQEAMSIHTTLANLKKTC